MRDGDGEGLVDVGGGAAGGLGDLEPGAQGVPALAVLGQVDGLGRGADHQLAAAGCPTSFSGVWPPRDTITPTGLLGLDDVHDVLVGERLEVEPVGGVVVGRHGLGVAVDHDRLEAGVAQGEAGVDAAVVELDALADAVGARAQDHDLGPVARARPRRCPRRSSSGTAWRPRTRRRRCRPSCRSAPRRPPCGRRARRPRRRSTGRPAGRRRSRGAWPGASRRGSCPRSRRRPGGPAPR